MVKICYVADIDFSIQNASTKRILNNCRALSYKSRDIAINLIGCSEKDNFSLEGFSVRNVKPGVFFLKRYLILLLKGFLFVNKLKNKIQIDCIIYYGVSSRILLPLYFYCKKNKIKLIADVVEWYDYSHLPCGRFGLFALDVHLGITKIIPKCDGAIVISSYLQRYFENKNLKTLRIPALVDSAELITSEEQLVPHPDTAYLNLIYAGFPGKKDMISNIINAVEQLNKDDVAVKLHILGPTKANLFNIISYRFSEKIICHGRIDQELVNAYLQQADFSILIRPKERYAQAGFPTKFVESMNAGVPVISNLTSDLNLYLKDGYNGFVLDDYTTEAIVAKVKNIPGMEKDQVDAMRINAKNTAIENFDFRLFSNVLKKFVS